MADALAPAAKPLILAVDDTPDNLQLISSLLKEQYSVKVATRGAKALQIAASEPRPDLILLDIMMPEMDGYAVIQQLRADEATASIPVIFLTAKAEVEDERRGLDLGAVDYITKPISPPILLARVKTHLTLKAARDFLRDKNAFLEAEVERRLAEIERIQDVFGKIVDPRVRDHLMSHASLTAGQVAEGTVLFCDIRGFTTIAESRDPHAVVSFLNRYLSGVAACVEREDGLVNKFIGDAVMAVFGTAFPLDDHRAAAIRCALDIREFVQQCNAAGGEVELRVGVGVHSGPVLAGVVGSPSRMEFTVIGDTVNTASRLEGLTKEYSVDLVISRDALRETEWDDKAKPLGKTSIRGRENPIELFTL